MLKKKKRRKWGEENNKGRRRTNNRQEECLLGSSWLRKELNGFLLERETLSKRGRIFEKENMRNTRTVEGRLIDKRFKWRGNFLLSKKNPNRKGQILYFTETLGEGGCWRKGCNRHGTLARGNDHPSVRKGSPEKKS